MMAGDEYILNKIDPLCLFQEIPLYLFPFFHTYTYEHIAMSIWTTKSHFETSFLFWWLEAITYTTRRVQCNKIAYNNKLNMYILSVHGRTCAFLIYQSIIKIKTLENKCCFKNIFKIIQNMMCWRENELPCSYMQLEMDKYQAFMLVLKQSRWDLSLQWLSRLRQVL